MNDCVVSVKGGVSDVSDSGQCRRLCGQCQGWCE